MVGVVDYTSDSDDEPVRKKRKLPHLPSTLTTTRPVDDPSKHQGRTRTKPHVDGQFAAYVLVPLRLDTSLRNLLSDIAAETQAIVPEMQVNSLTDLHVSLSKTLYIRGHQRDDLLKAVKRVAEQTTCFEASFTGFDVLCNDEKTRTFLTIEIGAGHAKLQALAEALQPPLELLRQEAYYSEPRFHISICWTLLKLASDQETSQSDQTSWARRLVDALENKFGNAVRKRMVFNVDQLRTRIGKRETVYQLAAGDASDSLRRLDARVP